jgi:hypothetical protein
VVATRRAQLQARLIAGIRIRGENEAVTGGQKVVTSIALGAGLAVVAAAVAARLNGPSDGGWFMYAPNSTNLYSASSSESTFRTATVRLAAIAIWFVLSWRLFRSDN